MTEIYLSNRWDLFGTTNDCECFFPSQCVLLLICLCGRWALFICHTVMTDNAVRVQISNLSFSAGTNWTSWSTIVYLSLDVRAYVYVWRLMARIWVKLSYRTGVLWFAKRPLLPFLCPAFVLYHQQALHSSLSATYLANKSLYHFWRVFEHFSRWADVRKPCRIRITTGCALSVAIVRNGIFPWAVIKATLQRLCEQINWANVMCAMCWFVTDQPHLPPARPLWCIALSNGYVLNNMVYFMVLAYVYSTGARLRVCIGASLKATRKCV